MSRRQSTTASFPNSPRRLKRRANDDDLISNLPESILGHILSRLPTKNAVSTGVLSKRWKFLWTTVGNLDFTFNGGSSIEQFVQSVNYVLLLHKPSSYFNKLSLNWNATHIPFYVNTWICAAVSKDVHELIVRVDSYILPVHVQSYLFSSEKLKSLYLNCNIRFSEETAVVVSLPRLESLVLNSVSFESEEALSKLVDGCPVLNHLIIDLNIAYMVTCGYIKTVEAGSVGVAFKCKISSTSLKRLMLYASGVSGPSLVCGIELDAPFLEDIYLFQVHSIVVVQQRLNFLREAVIQLASFENGNSVPNYLNSFVQALEAFSCAKSLHLLAPVVRALSCATMKMQTGFTRLTRLKVQIGQNYWSSVQRLIELSDNLKVLIVMKDAYRFSEEGQVNNSNWTKPDVVPRCMSNSLKKVLIGAYDDCPDELAMVEYIVKHGSILDIMHIRVGDAFSGVSRKSELLQLLSTSKKSTTCEVKFLDSNDHFDIRHEFDS